MEQKNGYVKGLISGSLTGGLIGAFIVLLYASKRGKKLWKDIKNKTDEYYDETGKLLIEAKIKANAIMNDGKKAFIKDDNALQLNIMGKAGIPKEEMHNYALSSVADGRILRDYVNEIKSGEITTEEAVKRVMIDYGKMKSGEKDGKFVTPSKS
jgi:gas vesicle protein